MYEWAFKHLHAAILLMFHLLSHPMALWYHAFCAMLSWSTEPYMLMEYWLDVPSTCRDYRIMACGFSGVELLLIGAQVMLRHDVMRELKYERALLEVDAVHVRYMEVVTCLRCKMKFFGDPNQPLSNEHSCRAQFVRHFFETHGDELSQSDYHIDTRSAISSKPQDMTSHPNIARWHDANERNAEFGNE